jgi:6-pyruvoyltetrahydropterin/6-carboxytetrahydropterin synthase
MRDWQYSRIGKEYHFSAAHQLTGVPEDHPCARLHGHNYVVEIEVRGDISPRNGFCNGLDFYDLDKAMKPLVELLDHRFINDTIDNPTAERIAQWFLRKLLDTTTGFVFGVKVWETPKCWAQAINSEGLFHKVHRD